MQDLSLQYYHAILHYHSLGLRPSQICKQLGVPAEYICRTLDQSLYLGLVQQHHIKRLLKQPLGHFNYAYVQTSPCIDLVNAFYNDRNAYEVGWKLAWLRLLRRYLEAQIEREHPYLPPKRQSINKFQPIDLKL